MQVYYAHCMSIYHTPQEKRDIELLESLGFVVLNPSHPDIEEAFQEFLKDSTLYPPMYFWHMKIEKCDVLAFKALPDGSISAGVASEIEYANKLGKPVFEIPTGIGRRTQTLEQTREYLREVGQR